MVRARGTFRRALVVAAVLLAGCTTTTTPTTTPGTASPAGPGASAKLLPTRGNQASGTVFFTQKGDKVLVKANVTGLKPNGVHGFHVHEKGDCSAADAMSAGGHFNPAASQHGNPASGVHHVGDMPNLKADADGVASLNWEETDFTLTDGPNSIVGRAIVVHLNPDDYKSQPAGNSGPRIACGVIAKN
jgi:Cu-Zn family superoxide dismutase